MKTQFQKATNKLKEFVTDMEKDGWKLKSVRFSLIKGVAKVGADVQNAKGEIVQFNQEV